MRHIHLQAAEVDTGFQSQQTCWKMFSFEAGYLHGEAVRILQTAVGASHFHHGPKKLADLDHRHESPPQDFEADQQAL